MTNVVLDDLANINEVSSLEMNFDGSGDFPAEPTTTATTSTKTTTTTTTGPTTTTEGSGNYNFVELDFVEENESWTNLTQNLSTKFYPYFIIFRSACNNYLFFVMLLFYLFFVILWCNFRKSIMQLFLKINFLT